MNNAPKPSAEHGRERRLTARALSRGVGVGRVIFLPAEAPTVHGDEIGPGDIDAEIARFRSALDAARRRLGDLAGGSTSDIFGVHLMILGEPSFIDAIAAAIREERISAEAAIRSIAGDYRDRQAAVEGEHFREKRLDIEDVARHLVAALDREHTSAATVQPGSVIVANELHPSTIIELGAYKPAAVISERGGWTSHASILARELALPMVTGIRDHEDLLAPGDLVIVDGNKGEVIVHPADATLAAFRTQAQDPATHDRVLSGALDPLATADGTSILIRANIDMPDAYIRARAAGARGIGLYRSESLISPSGLVPGEDEQFAAYRHIAEAAGNDGVRIRTFDIIPGDPGSGNHRLEEQNPALGLRAIRLSLADHEAFRIQLRAIIRAAYGNCIDIVLPMISGLGEVTRSKKIIAEERDRLTRSGIPAGDPKVGAMIEVPSAVLTADAIAGSCDLLCLGTNDLVQYLLAVDRDNDAVASLYESLHPAVILAIRSVVTAAHAASVPLSVCGEMAGSPFYVPLLIGLGVRELSIQVKAIENVRRVSAGITVEKCRDIVDSIMRLDSADQIEHALRQHYLENWSGLFPPGLLETNQR